MLCEADQLYATDRAELRPEFMKPVEKEYRDILAALKKKNRELAALSMQFQDAMARDYFASELGRQVRSNLLSTAGGKSS